MNALNATQVEVKFSTAVDAKSVLNDNGTVKDNTVTLSSLDGVPAEKTVNLSSGKLSADGKTSNSDSNY